MRAAPDLRGVGFRARDLFCRGSRARGRQSRADAEERREAVGTVSLCLIWSAATCPAFLRSETRSKQQQSAALQIKRRLRLPAKKRMKNAPAEPVKKKPRTATSRVASTASKAAKAQP